MYKLTIEVTIPEHNLTEYFSQVFESMNTTLDEHSQWRFRFNSAYGYPNSTFKVDFTTNQVIEIWEFFKLDDFNLAYTKMNSDNPSENVNRPYTMDSLNSAFKNFNVTRVDTLEDPLGNKTVLFDLSNT